MDTMEKKEKNSILIVDDSPNNLNVLFHLLRDDYTLYVAKNGLSAVEIAKAHTPDLILLDILMPDMNGFEVLRILKGLSTTKHIPIIFITALVDAKDEEAGLAMDAADYISKPFVPGIVRLRVGNQIKMVNYLREIERLSKMDELTKLANRRSFNEKLASEWGRAQREQTALGLIILDVDKFKIYNDTYGHQHGDIVLKTIAQILEEITQRSSDFVARWGGEEFIVLLPNTDADGAMKVAEKIRTEVEITEIPHQDGVSKVTVSAGVNVVVPDVNTIVDKYISDADEALYRAKSEGRNRVSMAGWLEL